MTRVILISLSFLLLTSMMWVASSLDGGGDYPSTAREVGNAFLKAYSKGDFTKAEQYITEESETAWDMVVDMHKDKKPTKFKYKLGEVHEENGEATLYYKVGEEQKSLSLVKEKGRWKVQFTKESVIGKTADTENKEKKKTGPKAHEKDAYKAGKAFLDAYAKHDYETAKKYISAETESAFEMLASINSDPENREPRQIVIGGLNEEADKATITYLENGEEKTLTLVREGKYWLVAFEKQGQGGMEELEKALEDALDSAAIDSL